MNTIDIVQITIGIIGSILTIGCFIPQGIKTLKTRDTSGISLIFPVVAATSSIFWIAAGIISISSLHPVGIASGVPVVFTNIITITINVIITIIKMRNMGMAKKQNITEAEYCLSLSKQSKAN